MVDFRLVCMSGDRKSKITSLSGLPTAVTSITDLVRLGVRTGRAVRYVVSIHFYGQKKAAGNRYVLYLWYIG